jgi:acyl carrier protein
MELFESIQGILTEILDLEDTELTPETYLIRDLGAESIDLIEIAVAMSYRFKIQVEDDEAFLKNFRLHLMEAQQKDLKPADYLAEK